MYDCNDLSDSKIPAMHCKLIKLYAPTLISGSGSCILERLSETKDELTHSCSYSSNTTEHRYLTLSSTSFDQM